MNKTDLINSLAIDLVNTIRNIPLTGDRTMIQIDQVLFLDLYFRNNLDIEPKLFDNVLQTEDLNYTKNNSGIFIEKKTSDIGLSLVASDILRRLSIECNVVKGYIVVNDLNGHNLIPHQWNEIRLNNTWYSYDFMFNLISYNYKNCEYKKLLKFIKLPVSPIDYSFVSSIGKNVKIDGNSFKNNNKVFDSSLITDDFSKYKLMDRFSLLSEYSKVLNYYNHISNELKRNIE
ncbi:MAG: transglutaminase domain-containing protein [Bacilli bacterium]